jgi:hypothetical protein
MNVNFQGGGGNGWSIREPKSTVANLYATLNIT